MLLHLKKRDRIFLSIAFFVFAVALFFVDHKMGFFAFGSILFAVFDTLAFHWDNSLISQWDYLKKHERLYEYLRSDWKRYKKSYNGIPQFFVMPFIDGKHIVKSLIIICFALSTYNWLGAIIIYGFLFNVYFEVLYKKAEK